MNWTGGRLQRHSTAADSIKHRQKQHFARVQQNLRSAAKFKSPAKWSVFDLIAEDRERSQRESSAVQLPKALSREKSRSISKHLAPLLPPTHAAGKRKYNGSKPSPVPDDDLYNATPPPWKYKQERKNSVSLSEVESFVETREEEEEKSMLEKRRRILRRGDWVGVGIQKPLHVAFASPRDEENIGRRRKIPHSHRARYETRQTHITSPFPTRARCPPHIAPSEWARQQQAATGRADVRISIGGRVVPPGLSSSSARTATRHRSQATPSDVMLLDNDDVFQPKQQRTPVKVAQHYSPWSGSHNASNHRPSGLSQVHSRSEEVDEELNGGQQPRNDHVFEGWAGLSPLPNGTTREETRDEHHPNAEEHGDIDESPLSNQEATSAPGLYNSPLPQQVVYSSSSSIHQPKPKSSRVSVLIQSESPEEARSTVAEVGQRKPAVPSSQALDNEAWESWIGHLFQEQRSEDRSSSGSTRQNQEANISPGISAVPSRKPFEIDTFSQRDEVAELETSEAEDHTQQTSSEWQQVTSEELESPSSRREFREIEEEAERSRSSEYSERESATSTQHDVHATHSLLPNTIDKPAPVIGSKEEDEDEVWRKFVFGSSSDGLEHEKSINTPAYNEAGNQSETSSSMLAYPATRQSIDSTWKTSSWNGRPARDTTSASIDQASNTQEFVYPRRVPPPRPSNKSEIRRGSTMKALQHLYTGNFRPNSRAKRIPASVAANAGSPSAVSTPPENSSTRFTQKKVLFTKPKPFVGRKSIESSSDEEPLHIGRNLLDDESTGGLERGRGRREDLYSFEASDDQDELESIEDD